MCEKDNYGIWIGENAVVALTNKLEIVFLRLLKDKIISIVKQKDDGVTGVAYGYNSELGSYCEIHIKNRDSQNSCAFPSDGGWYWSVKEVTDDFIILNSCGGGEDIRYKKRNTIYEFFL